MIVVKVHVDYDVELRLLRFISKTCKISVLYLMPLSPPNLEIAVLEIRYHIMAVMVVHVAPQIHVWCYIH